MLATRIWITNGAAEKSKDATVELSVSDELKRFREGSVRVTTGSVGTEVKWHVQTPCFTSIFIVMDQLPKYQAPICLRFFISGWFEEFFQDAMQARKRLEEILARGDRHFPVKTFVEKVDSRPSMISNLIQNCLNTQQLPEDLTVECVFESNLERFNVNKVGSKSLMSKLYGVVENSFAYQNSTSFSDAVSQGYREVLETGKPRTDHVLAALRMANNEVHWVPYHRLIFPKLSHSSKPGVSIIADLGNISFKVI